MRTVRLFTAFALACWLQAGVASAAADWLDKLSGPGPFAGVHFGYRFQCLSNGEWVSLAPWDTGGGFVSTGRRPGIRPAATAQDQARDNCNNDQSVNAFATLTVARLTSRENTLFPADPEADQFQG